jgi:hypothetical protein
VPITYPLSLPTTIGMNQITLYADNADAMSESPFSFSQQVFKHPGERWRASVSVAPSKKEFSEPWVAFLLSLRGRSGTFLLGDPARKQVMGTATSNPLVNGANQTGSSLIIDGGSLSQSTFLKAGDYIQLGTGLNSRLFKVLADVATNGSGQATIDVWPRIRTAPADNAAVIISNTVGLFRLSSGISSWQIDAMSTYGITFDCVEVI